MYGLFMVELYKYANSRLGADSWNALLKESGIGQRIYITSAEYPDQEMIDLVSAISKMTKDPVAVVLEDFGEFIAQNLIGIYGSLVDPRWKTLDLLENTGGLIHARIHSMNPETKPPDLKCERVAPDEVIVTYNSARGMCGMVKGLVKGFAKHYNERVSVTETRCMLKGHVNCEISVKLLSKDS